MRVEFFVRVRKCLLYPLYTIVPGIPNCSSFCLFYTYTRRCDGRPCGYECHKLLPVSSFHSSQNDCSVITQKTFWVKAFPYLSLFRRFHFYLTVYKIVLEQVAIKLAVASIVQGRTPD